jgi:hypothetical protein
VRIGEPVVTAFPSDDSPIRLDIFVGAVEIICDLDQPEKCGQTFVGPSVHTFTFARDSVMGVVVGARRARLQAFSCRLNEDTGIFLDIRQDGTYSIEILPDPTLSGYGPSSLCLTMDGEKLARLTGDGTSIS